MGIHREKENDNAWWEIVFMYGFTTFDVQTISKTAIVLCVPQIGFEKLRKKIYSLVFSIATHVLGLNEKNHLFVTNDWIFCPKSNVKQLFY